MATDTGRGSSPARQREYVAYALLVIGMMGIVVAMVVGIIRADTFADIFASDKAVRDAAAAGSSLLADQGRVAALEAWVLPLMFLSLASFITGIAIAFWSILLEVRRRGDAARDMMVAVRGRTS
jgi:uncharacterized membrane protein YhaH (DUF805 family)